MSPSWIWEPAVAYGMSHEGKGGEGSGQGISSVSVDCGIVEVRVGTDRNQYSSLGWGKKTNRT